MKHFEPIWGDSKVSHSSAPPAPSLSNWNYPKHKKTETITAPVTAPPVTTDIKIGATTTCSSSDNSNKIVESNIDITATEVIETEDIRIEDIQLQLPWDSVDSTIDSTTSPIIKDVVLPNVCVFILYLI